MSEKSELQYRYHFHMQSGAKVSSDFIDVDNDPYHDTIQGVAEGLSRWSKGEDGVFRFPVSENLTFVPFRNIEFASLEYVVAGERESAFATDDSEYVFQGQ